MFSGAYADAASALVDAANTSEWTQALDLVERAFGARGAILMGYDTFARHPVAVIAGSQGMRPDQQEYYLENFAALDVRAAFCARQPHGKVIYDQQMGTLKEIDRTPIYAEFLLPLDLGRFVGVNLGVGAAASAQSHTYFALAKDNRAGPPDDAEAAQVMAMGKHARSAVRTAGIVTALRADADRMRAAIERLNVGVVFLRAGGEVVDCNTAALRLFAESTALTYQRRRLSFRDKEADAKLKRVMQSDLAFQAGEMWIANAGGDGGALIVIAAHIEHADLEFSAPVLTLFLINPQRRARSGRGVWSGMFGLTPSECEVAELMLSGLSRREIAEQRGVSEGTVHTQMRSLYAKLQVSKLNEALLLLNATAGA